MAQSSNVGKGDVPGSSLNGRNPEHLKVAELKYWLTSKGLSTKGKKADIVVW